MSPKIHLRTSYFAYTDFTACGRAVQTARASEALAEVTCGTCRTIASNKAFRTASPEELAEETRRHLEAKGGAR